MRGLGGFVLVTILAEDVQGNLREPLADPGALYIGFLLALFIQRRHTVAESDVLGLLALTQQYVDAFVIQIDALLG